MTDVRTRTLAKCGRCKRRLLLNPDNNLCLCCEIDQLREQVAERDCIIASCRRERQNLLARLSKERAERA